MSASARTISSVGDDKEINRFALLRQRPLIVSGLALVVALGLWQLLPSVGLISKRAVVPLSTAIQADVSLASNGLATDVGDTVAKFLLGLLIGGSLGLVVGSLIGISKTARIVFYPLVAICYPLPRIALYPTILIIGGPNETSYVIMIALGPFFAMAIAAISGFDAIDPHYVEVARSYAARGWQLYRRVIIPSAIPIIVAGIRVAASAALVGTIAVEFLIGGTGIGHVMWVASQTDSVGQTFGTTAIIVVLGTIVYAASALPAHGAARRR